MIFDIPDIEYTSLPDTENIYKANGTSQVKIISLNKDRVNIPFNI